MNINARIQSVIEIIELIQDFPKKPADNILRDYLKSRRFIGSSDRRVIGDTVFAVLRHYHGLVGCLPRALNSARLLTFLYLILHDHYTIEQISELCTGEYGPEFLAQSEKNALLNRKEFNAQKLPEWINDSVDNDLVPFLFKSAPVDIRVNTLKLSRQKILEKFLSEKYEVSPTPYSQVGIRFTRRTPLHTHEFWQNGALEIQEEASQIAALLCDARPGMNVIDYCSGAGGKALAIASCMNNQGTLILSDISSHRLIRAKERLRRAGVSNYQIKNITEDKQWFKRKSNHFDRVVVDAPCSGTGTWRRNPDLKIRFTEQDLQELIVVQQEILVKSSLLVKPGGRMIYVTCSFLKLENENQMQNFLEKMPDFKIIPIKEIWSTVIDSACPFDGDYAQFLTNIHNTDCFFICVLEKKS